MPSWTLSQMFCLIRCHLFKTLPQQIYHTPKWWNIAGWKLCWRWQMSLTFTRWYNQCMTGIAHISMDKAMEIFPSLNSRLEYSTWRSRGGTIHGSCPGKNMETFLLVMTRTLPLLIVVPVLYNGWTHILFVPLLPSSCDSQPVFRQAIHGEGPNLAVTGTHTDRECG